MKNTRLKASVNNLVFLYTVVIGAALSIAVATAVDPAIGLASVTWPSSLLFASFVATLFPFFHGALRHLDDAYIENDNDHIRQGALIIDFILLFLHALVFVLLALLIRKPAQFAWVLSILLTIDVVWGLFAHNGASSRNPLKPEAKWAFINVVFVVIAATYLVLNDFDFRDVSSPLKLAVLVTCACFLRSIADYVWCKDFYFPR